MKIAILDYGAGNIKSVQNALDRIICRDALPYNVEYIVTNNITELKTADKIIFPGVGNAKFAMKNLKEKNLDKFLQTTTQPVLGICLGMQLLFDFSEEENTKCLGIIPGKIIKFKPEPNIKIPHMGWNKINTKQGGLPPCKQDKTVNCKLLTDSYYYFVHSYFAPINKFTIATCQYGTQTFSAAVQKDNFIGMQFHPEKSGKIGEQVLKKILEM